MARKKVTPKAPPKVVITAHEGVSLHLPPFSNGLAFMYPDQASYQQVATLGHLDDFVKAVRQRSEDKSPSIRIKNDGIHWTQSEDL